MPITRRGLIAAMGLGLAAPMLHSQARARVVVIGGGAGGVTAARLLAVTADVTLVEANPVYTSCFQSNHFLAGFRDLESLQFGYDLVAAKVVIDRAVAVDRDLRQVHLAGGVVLDYDRLLLSPGIDFVEDAVPGWTEADAAIMPHAFKLGAEVAALKAQLLAMPQGGVFAMIAPPDPYRCPPGPYERVSLIADLFTRINPTAKILLLDPKANFSKQVLFEDAWAKYYDGMIDRIDPDFGGADVEVRPAEMQVVVDGEVVAVDVCNVIPAQQAGAIARLAGVTDDRGWALVAPETMRSVVDPMVYVLGDACEPGFIPKSAFVANAQAHVAAAAVLADLAGTQAPPALFANICWSTLAPDDVVKVGAQYHVEGGEILSSDNLVSERDEDTATRAASGTEATAWYGAITAEMFGQV